MILCFLIPLLLADEWDPLQVIQPQLKSQFSKFGKSVSLASNSLRIAVGCPSTRDSSPGEVNLFDYDFETRRWFPRPPLTSTTSSAVVDGILYNVTIHGLGTSVSISTDGERVISGAPFTSYHTATTTFENVGAVLIFVYDDGRWTETFSAPPTLIVNGHYGAKLDASSDVKFYATTYASNSTVVAMEEVTTWTVPTIPSLQLPVSELISVQFADASTLLAASESGVSLLKKTWWGWNNKGVLQLPDSMKSSGHVSMPENDQFTIAISAYDSDGPLVAFLNRNDVDNTWVYNERAEIRYEPGAAGTHLDFCQNTLLAVIGTVGNGERRVVFLFSRSSNGVFELEETIEQPLDDRDPDFHLEFASSIAWENGNCWRLAIGSVAQEYETSRVYIYQMSGMLRFKVIMSQYHLLSIILTLFAGGLLIAISAAVVGHLIIRYRRNRIEQQRANSHGANLI